MHANTKHSKFQINTARTAMKIITNWMVLYFNITNVTFLSKCAKYICGYKFSILPSFIYFLIPFLLSFSLSSLIFFDFFLSLFLPLFASSSHFASFFISPIRDSFSSDLFGIFLIYCSSVLSAYKKFKLTAITELIIRTFHSRGPLN